MSESKIVIEISGPMNPPKVFVDEEEVLVISLDYQYETKTSGDPGEHKFHLAMPYVVDDSIQTQGVAFDRNSQPNLTS